MTVSAEKLGSGFQSLDPEEVRNIKIPTLLVTGQQSINLIHCLTDRLEELMLYTEWVEISAASHMMHEDNATACNSAVLSFLSRERQVV
jgi:pimeloyl-ACP methyl ester carboxylesterase